jgi:exonuclease VII large subunit
MLIDNIQFWAKRLSSRGVQIDDHKMLIADISENITRSLNYQMNIYLNRVEGIYNHVNSLAPDKILKRGYSIVQKMPTGNIISLKSNVKEGDKINIVVSDGEIAAEVN